MSVNDRELVVRIVQPADHPQPQVQKVVQVATGEKGLRSRKDKIQVVTNVALLTAIAFLLLFFVASLFSLGLAFKDIVLLFGLPLALGIFASYLIF